MSRPKILVTNDDGVIAPGIRALVETMIEFGDVVVVAPDGPQSGMGHAVTLERPIRVEKVSVFKDLGVDAYQTSGTPADCVKLAIDKILMGKPDICVAGINHGSNSSINIIYSGTMSAAMEAAIDGINAIGFSLCDYSYDANFEPCKPFIREIVQQVLEHGLPRGSLLNVNIPKRPEDEIKGMKICRQAVAKWEEDFDERMDPRGKKYFWLTGKFVNNDKGEDTDEWALDHGYVSIVPVQYDLTNNHAVRFINKNWNIKHA